MNDLIKQLGKENRLYPIYVPSHGRAGTAPFLNLMAKAPKAVQQLVHVVVRASEATEYQRVYPWFKVVKQRGPKGIGPARMVCLQDADQRGFKRIAMLDDDITKIGLLEDRGPSEDGKGRKSGRYSIKNTSWQPWEYTLLGLSLGCSMADAVFALDSGVAYGSTRSAFMSNSEDVRITATIDKGGFPLCVLFIDLERFTMRDMPKAFQWEGEDLAMYLQAYDDGYSTFIFNNLIFDDDRAIASTIPFSGDGEVDRSGNLRDAERRYKRLGPYLKVTNRNKETGAIKRISVDWRAVYGEHGVKPRFIRTKDVVKYLKERS